METSILLALTVSSVVILCFGVLLMIRLETSTVAIGLAFLYYWSLYGAWSIVFDKIGNVGATRYSYLEEKLFPVNLDESYLKTVVLYASFIIMVEVGLWFWGGGLRHRLSLEPKIVYIRLDRLLIFASMAWIGSIIIIGPSVVDAYNSGRSTYYVARFEASQWYTVHQVLYRAALGGVCIGLAIWASGNGGRRLRAKSHGAAMGLAYTLAAIAMYAFSLLLGNKNEPLWGGTLGTLFYIANASRPRRGIVLVAALAGCLGLGLVEVTRGVSPQVLFASLTHPQNNLVANAIAAPAQSNEAFSAHFSLYGAIHLDLAPTYGMSFVSLAASVVPRVLWPSRPGTAYDYYAGGVDATAGEGYSLHHATGWYLNFGVAGVLIGGALLGRIWAWCLRVHLRSRWIRGAPLLCVASACAPSLMIAGLPSLVRAGIEGYKGLVVEFVSVVGMLLLCRASAARYRAHSGNQRVRRRQYPGPVRANVAMVR